MAANDRLMPDFNMVALLRIGRSRAGRYRLGQSHAACGISVIAPVWWQYPLAALQQDDKILPELAFKLESRWGR
jgi:hypothetical protein